MISLFFIIHFLFLLLSLRFLAFAYAAQTANVTVALDGTGNFRSIGEAVSAIPNNSESCFYIYVKKGIYKEYVYFGPEKRNITLFEDGINQTIITSDRSNHSGYDIKNSAALNINSKSFLVKDISIINTAGPYAGQAVALRTAGDYIACHRCSIEGYQDTLNAHFGNNQFFFDCHIYGTIDFIFGYAAVVIQNSYIHVRLPREGQQNVITADGRYQEMNNTAIVIHNCSIIPTPELKSKSHVKTYLGRPWKKLSRTIIMESYLDGFIDPQGWIEFDNQSDITALYYAEYHNYGQGSSTSGRVKWPGYHILDNPNDVQSFTVENFIKGSEWLPKLEIPYIPGLVR
ncbi:hypothetical protein ACOSP7_008849 [Xanthoceras sorbifolium]